MKLLILLLTITGLFVNKNEVLPTSTELLAGATQKSWYMYSKSPESTISSCQAGSAQSQDNSWIFYANGTFEFNHGTTTSDSSCQEQGCCSDMLNMMGNWSFINSGNNLKIFATHQKENPAKVINQELLQASIFELSASKLIVKQTDGNGVEYTIEFRPR